MPDIDELRKRADWYREFSERAGNPWIWAARLQIAERLEAEAAQLGVRQGTVEFHVRPHDHDLHWVVRLGGGTYGDYVDKEQAVLDAIEAARDAQESGREAQVWLRDHDESAGQVRIF